jgi:hypothetical protein
MAQVDIVVAAPAGRAEADALRARNAAMYWAPTPRAVRLLRDAGVPASGVRLTRLGVDADRFQPGERHTPNLTVWTADVGSVADVAIDVIGEHTDADALAASLARSQVVLLPGFADPYDLVIVAALTAGCIVVTTAAVAADCDLADLLDVADDADLVTRALELARAGGLDERFAAIRRATLRRRSMPHAAARLRELARAQLHGPVDGARGALRASASFPS